jgi:hypothetical protein
MSYSLSNIIHHYRMGEQNRQKSTFIYSSKESNTIRREDLEMQDIGAI